jgi:coenzyme F420-reducing hydrogenase alpha subunit
MNKEPSTKTVTVDYVTRVEGKAALSLTCSGETITDVQLQIFEPPRLFESILRGRSWTDAPDMTARICGICPVAYQISAAQAMEKLAKLTIPKQAQSVRRLLMCGEWIVSHTIHIYLLHAPDFLGFANAIEMAKHYPEQMKRGLALKEVGNEILTTLGGRSVHPVNLIVGGVCRLPSVEELTKLKERLEFAVDLARETLSWVSSFSFPDFTEDYIFLSLSNLKSYPLTDGKLVTNRELVLDESSFGSIILEEQLSYSTALASTIGLSRERYITGPMARFALNGEFLPEIILSAIEENSIPRPCCNPFRSIQVRALEVWFACSEALLIVEDIRREIENRNSGKVSELKPRAGIGIGITEAPRGVLFQRYEIDAGGLITNCTIIPPTAQNQKQIEKSMLYFLNHSKCGNDDELRECAEKIIRSFDPCISCATHFLSLEVQRL